LAHARNKTILSLVTLTVGSAKSRREVIYRCDALVSRIWIPPTTIITTENSDFHRQLTPPLQRTSANIRNSYISPGTKSMANIIYR